MRRVRPRSRPRFAALPALAWLAASLLLIGCETTIGPGAKPQQPAPPRVIAPAPGAQPPRPVALAQPPRPAAIAEQPIAAARPIPPPAPPPPVPAAERIKVALLLPLTGASADLGRAMLDAATLALFEIGDETLEILPRDSGATAETAATAAAAALRDGARLLLGPVFAATVAAVAPVARQAGVNVIGFSTDRAVAGGGVYLIGFLPDQEVERIVGFARRSGLTRFAALAPDNAYGHTVVAAYESAVQRQQRVRVAIGFYPIDGDARAERQRLTAVVRQVVGFDRRRAQGAQDATETVPDVTFDAMLIADGGARLRAVAPFLNFYDVDTKRVRLLGTSQWEGSDLRTEPALHGGWYAGPLPPVPGGFEARYQAAYGAPANRLAALAYDAVAIAAVLAAGAQGADFSAQAITAANGFSGASGIFRFRPDGLAERNLAVLEVGAEGVRVVDPPPPSFDALAN